MYNFSADQKVAMCFIICVALIAWCLCFSLTRVNVAAINNGYTITTDAENHTQYTPPTNFQKKD